MVQVLETAIHPPEASPAIDIFSPLIDSHYTNIVHALQTLTPFPQGHLAAYEGRKTWEDITIYLRSFYNDWKRQEVTLRWPTQDSHIEQISLVHSTPQTPAYFFRALFDPDIPGYTPSTYCHEVINGSLQNPNTRQHIPSSEWKANDLPALTLLTLKLQKGVTNKQRRV